MRQTTLAALTIVALAGAGVGAVCLFEFGLDRRSEESASPADWCAEHGVPESACLICNPGLAAADPQDWCAEHGVPESRCAICQPGVENPALPIIRFAREDTALRAGIETAAVETRAIEDAIEAPGRLAFDESRRAHVTSAAGGIVREVATDLGRDVEKGAVIAVIASDAVAETRSALTGAIERAAFAKERLEREAGLEAQKISRRDALLEAREAFVLAEGAVRASRERLRMLGADPNAAAPAEDPSRLEIRSPLSGTVVARHAVLGERVNQGDQMFEIVDLARLALLVQVPEAEATRLATGHVIEATSGGACIEGRIDWISSEVDPATRTVVARAFVPNEARALRANVFVGARIRLGDAEAGPAVPTAALQRTDTGAVVFVRTGPASFEPRAVEILASDGEWARLRGAVSAGEIVATEGSFLLKTEILKGNIGAGCCDEPATQAKD